jgi:hypothetical protein
VIGGPDDGSWFCVTNADRSGFGGSGGGSCG